MDAFVGVKTLEGTIVSAQAVMMPAERRGLMFRQVLEVLSGGKVIDVELHRTNGSQLKAGEPVIVDYVPGDSAEEAHDNPGIITQGVWYRGDDRMHSIRFPIGDQNPPEFYKEARQHHAERRYR